MEKKSILEIQSVYTANAFTIDGVPYVGAGSETTPAVYLHDLLASTSSLVNGCPGMDNYLDNDCYKPSTRNLTRSILAGGVPLAMFLVLFAIVVRRRRRT